MPGLLSKIGGRATRWQDAALFDGLDADELAVVESIARRRTLEPGERYAEEGGEAGELVVVVSGALELVKQERKNTRTHAIAEIGPGEVIGEVALYDGKPHAASVRSTARTEVLTLPFGALRSGVLGDTPAHRSAYQKLVLNLGTSMARRLRGYSEESVAAAQRRAAMGQFIVNVLLLLCLYVVVVAALPRIEGFLPSSTSWISIPLQLLFGIASWRFIRRTGYPLYMFGIGLRSLLSSLLEAIVLTVPLLAAVTLVKWVLLHVVPAYAGVALFEHTDVVARFSDAGVEKLMLIYALSSLVQELIVRGALQSTLEMLLTGPHAVARAVFVSALVFSVNHIHMSFVFAAMAFLPGLYWGWMFSRRRNLAGVTLSHVAVGAYVFFLLGVSLPH